MKHTSKQIVVQQSLRSDQQYTNVTTLSNRVLARARARDGAPIYADLKYQPTYFHPVNPDVVKPSHFGYDGTPLKCKKFMSLFEARQWIEQVEPLPVFGDIQPEYMMLSDIYGCHDCIYTPELLYVWNLDIEVDSAKGFAKPEDPFGEVTAITVQWRHLGETGTVVYGRKPYSVVGPELYLQCPREEELLLRFLDDFRSAGDYPDILTGWNIQFYDIPYLAARLQRLFSEDTWSKLSPYETLATRPVQMMGRQQTVIDIRGVAILDYQEAYKKFRLVQRESYRLDHIAHVELGQRKVSYAEYKSLRRLYEENHQKFIEYNIRDVSLVDMLDQKLKYLDLIGSLAYNAKSNFVDCFKQVRLWDIMIYHRLRADGLQIPPRKEQTTKSAQYAGAYVKDPTPGLYPWVVSFDVASMYPHIIRQWNLSPETKFDDLYDHGLTVRDTDGKKAPSDALIAGQIDLSGVKAEDYCVAANGVLTERAREGFLPNMLKALYEERVKFKKLQKAAEKDREAETDPAKKAELSKKIAAFSNNQQVRKVNLNSAYGAMGSEYFRFFDIDLAEAVTVTGQMVIRRIAKDLNDYLNRTLKTNADYIIASDTDSVYIDVTKVVAILPTQEKPKILKALQAFCEKQLQPVINASFEAMARYMNVATPCMSMAHDVIADNCIWRGSKNYALHQYYSEGVWFDKPKLLVHGLEIVRSSTPPIARDMMSAVITKIAEGGNQRDIWTYLGECRAKFDACPFEDIAKSSTANHLDKYSETSLHVPIHVAGAHVFNRYLAKHPNPDYEPVQEGEKVKWVYLTQPNPFRAKVMTAPGGCPPEWEIEKWIDYDKQYDKLFLDPVTSILECAGMKAVQVPSLF